MKLVKVLGIVIVVLALIAAGAWQFGLKDLKKDAEVGTAFAAKHVCSCLHIAERSMDMCLQDFVQPVGQLDITNEGNVTTAKAPFGLGIAKAKYEPGLGCAFVKP